MANVMVLALGRPRIRLMSWFLREAGLDAADVDGAIDHTPGGGADAPVVLFNTTARAAEVAAAVKDVRATHPSASIIVLHPRDRDEAHADVAADVCLVTTDLDRVIEAVREVLAGPPHTSAGLGERARGDA